MKRLIVVGVLLVGLLFGAFPASASSPYPTVAGFEPLATYHLADTNELQRIAASSDGHLLIAPDSTGQLLHVIDLSNPAQPAELAGIPLNGQPTDVAVTPDGSLALVALNTSQMEPGAAPSITPGSLLAIDLTTHQITASFTTGDQPSAIELTTVDGQLYAVVAISNEPVLVDDDGNLAGPDSSAGEDISAPGQVDIIAIDLDDPAASITSTVSFSTAAMSAAGLLFPDDPQPKQVAIHDGLAAVTLQANNGVAVIDLDSQTTQLFSTGTVDNRRADLTANRQIAFTDIYPKDAIGSPHVGARMPDSIAWSPDGSALYTADEGLFDYTGGRGWSAWTPEGQFLWDDGGQLERLAVTLGHYPENRSSARGIEIEGVAAATFDGHDFAFAGSERGSFVAVYDISNAADPAFVQLLATGIAPEEILALPDRGLLITADEVSHTLSIFQYTDAVSAGSASQPRIHSLSASIPWGAISGIAAGGNQIFAVPDSDLQPAIYRISPGNGGEALLNLHASVRASEGSTNFDLEGITIDTTSRAALIAGFWLVSEGNAAYGQEDYRPNLLIQTDRSGNVTNQIALPAAVDSRETGQLSERGLSGVTVSDDGRALVVSFESGFTDDRCSGDTRYSRIARYDLWSGTWDFFLYPLSQRDGATRLTDIVRIDQDRYAVIEESGDPSGPRRLAIFSLDGLDPWDGPVQFGDDLSGHLIQKEQTVDLVSYFQPFGNVEALTIADGQLWAATDNDAGQVETKLVNLGDLEILPVQPVEPASDLVNLQILAVNDLHGQVTTGQEIDGRAVGGAAYLAAYIKQHEAQNPENTLLVSAGDAIGASWPVSGLLQDEPMLAIMNALGFDVATVGNHEFDEGYDELRRLIDGGCNPATEPLTGCFPGVDFPYLGANVVFADSGEPALVPYVIQNVEGIPVGFIGTVITTVPNIVVPSGVAGLKFLDQADAINRYVDELQSMGVEAIIVVAHDGFEIEDGEYTGGFHDVVDRIDPAIDLIISGHTHEGYLAQIDCFPITSAYSYSEGLTDIDLTLDPGTGDVVDIEGELIQTWNDAIAPDPEIEAMVEHYESIVGPLINHVVGMTEADITRVENAAGESALGNLIADAHRVAGGSDFAVTNDGGIRTDILAGDVTWGDLYAVQPFGNTLVTMELTGQQMYDVLNQQWRTYEDEMLQISGFEYDWDPSRAMDDRVIEIRQVLAGGETVPLDRAATYSITMNSFLAEGGDDFSVFTQGSNAVIFGDDLDALVDYIGSLAQPFSASIEGRITIIE